MKCVNTSWAYITISHSQSVLKEAGAAIFHFGANSRAAKNYVGFVILWFMLKKPYLIMVIVVEQILNAIQTPNLSVVIIFMNLCSLSRFFCTFTQQISGFISPGTIPANGGVAQPIAMKLDQFRPMVCDRREIGPIVDGPELGCHVRRALIGFHLRPRR